MYQLMIWPSSRFVGLLNVEFPVIVTVKVFERLASVEIGDANVKAAGVTVWPLVNAFAVVRDAPPAPVGPVGPVAPKPLSAATWLIVALRDRLGDPGTLTSISSSPVIAPTGARFEIFTPGILTF